jgi:oligogalacturonide lyase
VGDGGQQPPGDAPAPSFTPDDSAILFSSDKDGKPAIYIAKLPDHPPMLSA